MQNKRIKTAVSIQVKMFPIVTQNTCMDDNAASNNSDEYV